MFEEVPLAKITIGTHFRQDLGDIPSLATSIERQGLLHPIIVSTDYTLVIGRRRLAAHEHLGRITIAARVIDLDDPLAAEWDENEQRKDYVMSERIAIGEARKERDKQEATERQREHGRTAPGKKKNTSVKFTEVSEQPQSRDVTAKAVGLSWPTYKKAKAVVEAAREDPDFQDLVEAMDRTGNVSRAYKQLPPYAREENPQEITPKKARVLQFPTIMQRLDHAFQTVLVPSIALLDNPQRANVRNLLQLYLTMLDQSEESKDAQSA